VAMMLVIGQLYPRDKAWSFERSDKLDLRSWRYAMPCALTLASSVTGLYLLFSPIGLVDGISVAFWPLILTLVGINMLAWWNAGRQKFARTE
jgi:SSS family solute:Na+ symporter